MDDHQAILQGSASLLTRKVYPLSCVQILIPIASLAILMPQWTNVKSTYIFPLIPLLTADMNNVEENSVLNCSLTNANYYIIP